MQCIPSLITSHNFRTSLLESHLERREQESEDEDSDDEAAQEDAQIPNQDDSDSETEESFIETLEQPKPKKKKQKKHHDPDERRPLADHRQPKRSNYHSSSMPRTTKAAARAARAAENRAPPPPDQEDAATLKRKLEESQAQVAALLKQPAAKKKGAKKTGTERAVETEVKKATAEFLWPYVKFITSEKKLKALTGKLFDKMDLLEKEGKEGPDLEVAKKIWVAEWADTVRIAYNSHRNYVNQQLLDVCKPYLLDGSFADQLPTPEQLKQVVLRKGMAKNAADRVDLLKFFVFYWAKFLPTVAGRDRWGPNEKYYQCIWEATRKDPGKKDGEDLPCVTESDEAFLVALYTNVYKKWVYKFHTVPDPNLQDKNHPDMATPYTNPKGGQVRFGGWYDEGIKAFKKLKKDITDTRKKRYTQDLENEVLRLVRELVDRDTYDAEQAAKKKKRKGKKKAVQEDEDEELDDDIEKWE